MNRVNRLHRFDLHYHDVLNNQVYSIAEVNLLAFINYRESNLGGQ